MCKNMHAEEKKLSKIVILKEFLTLHRFNITIHFTLSCTFPFCLKEAAFSEVYSHRNKVCVCIFYGVLYSKVN